MTSLKHLDLKSVPCPLNVVKIKLALEKLSKNEQLIVELDKGEPEEMVLSNLKEMGCLFTQIKEHEKFLKINLIQSFFHQITRKMPTPYLNFFRGNNYPSMT